MEWIHTRREPDDIKTAWLTSHGYIGILPGGEPALSPRAVALLSDTPLERIKAELDTNHAISPHLLRDMRRGANGVMARHGTEDVVDLLYAEATAWEHAHGRMDGAR